MKLKQNEQFLGVASAAGAYLWWGMMPIYWKLISHISADAILAHRIIWSFVFMLCVLLATNRIRLFIAECRQIIAQPKKLAGIVIASVLISLNWLVYIWAVNDNRVIETSLGYYINPLVSVLLGLLVLKEKLTFWQTLSFLLAAAGVLNMVLHFGTIPWVALSLAVSFGLYGLLKKMVKIGALTGITLETMLVAPVALIYLTQLRQQGSDAWHVGFPLDLILLMGTGVATAIPLILFANGTNRLPLSVLGFIQYVSPTMTLLLGVFVYHESFTSTHFIAFSFIWLALLVFSLSKTEPFIRFESTLVKRFANREA